MNQERITPHKVTRPMQLLAAWLVSLIALEGALLTAAGALKSPPWAPGALVITAIVIIPLFVGALFLLLTKYRKELQDDKYYSEDQTRKNELNKLREILSSTLQESKLEPKIKEVLIDRLAEAEAEVSSGEYKS